MRGTSVWSVTSVSLSVVCVCIGRGRNTYAYAHDWTTQWPNDSITKARRDRMWLVCGEQKQRGPGSDMGGVVV